jgi:hypothetical protein
MAKNHVINFIKKILNDWQNMVRGVVPCVGVGAMMLAYTEECYPVNDKCKSLISRRKKYTSLKIRK